MTNTEQFVLSLAENFRDIRYDPKKKSGTATIPNVGLIEFHEAANDPAVILNVTFPKRFKGSAESALDFIDKLSDAWSNSD